MFIGSPSNTNLHRFLPAIRRVHIGISFSRCRPSSGVLGRIVGKAVRDLVVSPLSLVEFIVGNGLLLPPPTLYAQPCVSWKLESRPPYNRCNPDHDLGRKWKAAGLAPSATEAMKG